MADGQSSERDPGLRDCPALSLFLSARAPSGDDAYVGLLLFEGDGGSEIPLAALILAAYRMAQICRDT